MKREKKKKNEKRKGRNRNGKERRGMKRTEGGIKMSAGRNNNKKG